MQAVALQTKFHSPANFKKSWEYAKDVYTCFLDLEKANDRVLLENLWAVLKDYYVDGLYFCPSH